MTELVSGGCQCGAVRFRAGNFGRSSICHCRMCQKAFSGFFAALVTANDFTLTRGTLRHFQSSNKVKRGFCENCGTPLTFEPEGFAVEVSVAALDDPDTAPPTIQVNPTDKLPFFDSLCALPTRPDSAEPKQQAFKASLINYQHPDHDTESWPPRRPA
jgi:hypothetical protein